MDIVSLQSKSQVVNKKNEQVKMHNKNKSPQKALADK